MGSGIKPENKELDKFLNAEGVMCVISAGPQYDKLKTTTERADAYRAIFEDGTSILESDFPIEVSKATKEDLDC